MRISQDDLRFVNPPINGLYDSESALNLTSISGDFALQEYLRALEFRLVANSEDLSILGRYSSLRSSRAGDINDVTARIDDDSASFDVVVKGDFACDCELPDGWKTCEEAKLPIIDKYLSQIADTRIFINDEKKRVVVVVTKFASSKWIQALISTIPMFVKWLVPEITPEIEKLSRDISVEKKDDAKSAEAFLAFINAIADTVGMSTIILHKQLDGYASRTKRKRLETARSTYRSIAEEISECSDRISRLYADLEENIVIINALENNTEDENNAVFEFFASHRNLSVESVSNETLNYVVDEMIEFFDENEAKANYENPGSYVHRLCDGDDGASAVYKALFVDRLGTLHAKAKCQLSGMRSVRTMSGTSGFGKDIIPHPHIARFACDGTNRDYYNEFAKKGDWELGIEQTIAAVKNLNMGDSTVVRWTFEWLSEHADSKCILTSLGGDGERFVSYDEFKNLIKGE